MLLVHIKENVTIMVCVTAAVVVVIIFIVAVVVVLVGVDWLFSGRLLFCCDVLVIVHNVLGLRCWESQPSKIC